MLGKVFLNLMRLAYTSNKELRVQGVSSVILVSTLREPSKLTGNTWKELLCNFYDSNKCIVSWALKSLSPNVLMKIFFIKNSCGSESFVSLKIPLNVSFNIGDLGSPFAAYLEDIQQRHDNQL